MARKFEKINIEITNICNLQCSFCPEVERAQGLMTEDLFRHVLKEVAPHTRLVALHLMGEPLLHPKLKEFIGICSEMNARVFLVTNGVLLKEKDFETLLHPIVQQVSFSLHSFPDNFGDKDIEPYLNRIFEYSEEAFKKRPTQFLNYRIWNEDPVMERTLSLIEKRFQIAIPRKYDFRVKKNFPVKNRLSMHFDEEFVWPALDLPVLGTQGTCHALKSHIGVLVDGTVVPCCLDKEAKIPLGNLRVQSLTEILQSEKAKKILEGFKANKLVEDLCQRCQYIERFK